MRMAKIGCVCAGFLPRGFILPAKSCTMDKLNLSRNGSTNYGYKQGLVNAQDWR